MHPADCPREWEHDKSPHRDQLLVPSVTRVLVALYRGGLDTFSLSCDTRPIHLQLFERLTPPACEYFAGHYRGEDYKCLRFCEVEIQSDASVGCPSSRVLNVMGQLASAIATSLRSLDEGHKTPNSQLSAEQKLLFVVACACRMFELFLRIHPYVNGNGHAARFLVWAILGRYGYWPKRWPLHPRPNEPYIDLIRRYRNGDMEPLEKFMVQNIIGSSS